MVAFWNEDGRYMVSGLYFKMVYALCSIACAWAIRIMLIKENQRLKASTNERVNLYGY